LQGGSGKYHDLHPAATLLAGPQVINLPSKLGFVTRLPGTAAVGSGVGEGLAKAARGVGTDAVFIILAVASRRVETSHATTLKMSITMMAISIQRSFDITPPFTEISAVF
jgi:hypothetical protein